MSTSTLTERYVHEVVRRIPADQRDDVANELRATIADAIDARNPTDPGAAEREVLIEMGDPIRLAARYADRPLALIGPDLYPTYIRLLTLLLSTVLPLVTAAAMVVNVFENNNVGSAIGVGVDTVLNVGAQMIAWLTVIFALIDRTRYRESAAGGTPAWTPDDLPELPEARKPAFTICASAVWYTLLIGLILWQHFARPYRANGESITILNPDLWLNWIWPILAGLVTLVVLDLLRTVTRTWTFTMAIWYAAANAFFALPLAWILQEQMLFNPDFLNAIADGRPSDAVYTIAALGVLVVSAVEMVRRFREVRR